MSELIDIRGKYYYQDSDVNIDFDNEITEIKVCGCDTEYQVPLIWTFAFSGAEYWCPYCGDNMGMMGAGENVPITKEIVERGNKYKEISKDYLKAKSTLVCESLMFEGERISPNDLPGSEKEKNDDAIEKWEYNVKV